MREIFDLAIKIEKNGEKFYREAMKKISNPSLNETLQWLADQEAKHISWFSERKEMVKTTGVDRDAEEMGSAILQSVMGDQSFSLEEADLSKIDKVEDLLTLAVEFENDSILFYEMIGSFIEDVETSQKLNEIIAEENRHVELLQDFTGQEADVG